VRQGMETIARPHSIVDRPEARDIMVNRGEMLGGRYAIEPQSILAEELLAISAKV